MHQLILTAARNTELPTEIREYCVRRGLLRHAEEAAELALTVFPNGSAVTFQLEEDPESEGQWLVIDVRVAAEVDDALRAYDRWVANWIQICPPAAGDFIRLTFNLS